jgi:hypothetical protein
MLKTVEAADEFSRYENENLAVTLDNILSMPEVYAYYSKELDRFLTSSLPVTMGLFVHIVDSGIKILSFMERKDKELRYSELLKAIYVDEEKPPEDLFKDFHTNRSTFYRKKDEAITALSIIIFGPLGGRHPSSLYEDNKLRMVTTDGKRLAKIEKEIDIKESFSKVVVPPKILQEALKLCNGDDKGDLKVGINEKEIFINVDNCFFISNLLDSGFPSYQSVIPANSAKSFKVNRKDFKDAIDRVSVMGEKDTHKVIISLSGNTMKIYSENMTYGDGEETIDIEYDSDDIKIAFNFSYITDVISVIKNDNLIFKFNNASSTIVILEEDNPDYIYIMMPMSV